jgi:hypothetical protein
MLKVYTGRPFSFLFGCCCCTRQTVGGLGGVGDGIGFYCCQLHVNMQFNRLSCLCCTATGISKRRTRKELYMWTGDKRARKKKMYIPAQKRKEIAQARVSVSREIHPTQILVNIIHRKNWEREKKRICVIITRKKATKGEGKKKRFPFLYTIVIFLFIIFAHRK